MTHDAGAWSPACYLFSLSHHPQKPGILLRLEVGVRLDRCQDAGPQYDRKANNEPGSYSVGRNANSDD